MSNITEKFPEDIYNSITSIILKGLSGIKQMCLWGVHGNMRVKQKY